MNRGILGIVVPASLMLLNSFFENVQFVLVTALLGVRFEPRPKEPQDSDRDDHVYQCCHVTLRRSHGLLLADLSYQLHREEPTLF